MKIIIPFDSDRLFSIEDISLLRVLKLEPVNVIDQALSHWTKYTMGNALEAHEQTLDDMYELIHSTVSASEIDTVEEVLEKNSDRLTQLVQMSAMYLEPLLCNIPDEIDRIKSGSDREESEHVFMKVQEIDNEGKFAVLTSDTIHL